MNNLRKIFLSTLTYNKYRLHMIIGCLFLIFLTILRTSGSTSKINQRADQPPCAKIIYSSQNANGGWHLLLSDWPVKTWREITFQTTGQYEPGTDVRTPRFSPNGDMAVFVGNRRNKIGQETHASDPLANIGLDLWFLDIKNNKAKPLTIDGAGYETPQWSPDGRSVIAISDNSYLPSHPIQQLKMSLCIWDVVSGKKSLLAKNVGTAIWSPDSNYIYYEKTDETGFFYTSRNGGKTIRFLLPKQEAYIGGWSPDGKCFAYFDGGQLIVIDKEKKHSINLGIQEKAIALKWSPDGLRIALVRSPSLRSDILVLVVVNVKLRKERILWSVKGFAEVTSWSNNSKWIIVSHTKPDSMFNQELLAIPLSGKSNVPLVSQITGTFGFDWNEILLHR